MSLRNRRSGYTLIEILGAFFIMTIILTLVTGIFVENGRQRAAALALIRESLSATAVLDQVSQDLEAAIFLKDSSGRQPDEYAWRFFADDYGELGSQSIRFVSQNAPSQNRGLHMSGWVEIAYFLEENNAGENVLWRWVSPRPPSENPVRFPRAGEEGTMRIAVDVDDFGLRFLDLEGEWLDDWDSAYQTPLAPLPAAVELNLRLMREARRGESEDGAETVPGPLHARRVAIRMPPIDVQQLLDLGESPEDAEEDCFTVAQCLAEGDNSWYEEELDEDCGGDDELCDLLAASEQTCWSEIESAYPAVADRAPESCVQ